MESLTVLDFGNAPWEKPEDWLTVYVMIQNQHDEHKLKIALKILIEWQTVAATLPRIIECTLLVVSVRLDEKTNDKPLPAKTTYSSVLLTFFKLCNVTGNVTNDFLQRRKNLDIPEWMETARKNILSNYDSMTEDELKEYIRLCYNWILTTYWHKEAAETYMIPFKSLHLLTSMYCYIVSINYFSNNYVSVQDLKLANGTMHAKMVKCLNLFRVTPCISLQEVSVQIMELLSDLRVTYGEVSLKMAISSLVHSFDRIFFFREGDNSETVTFDHIQAWSKFVNYLCEFNVLGHFVTELTMAIIYGLFNQNSQRYAGAWVHHLLQRILVTRLHADNLANPETYRSLNLPNLNYLLPFSNCPADNIIYHQIQTLDILLDREEFNADVWKFLHTLSFITRYHCKIQEWKRKEEFERIQSQVSVSQTPSQEHLPPSLTQDVVPSTPMQTLVQPIQMTLQPIPIQPPTFLTFPTECFTSITTPPPTWYYPTINAPSTSRYY